MEQIKYFEIINNGNNNDNAIEIIYATVVGTI